MVKRPALGFKFSFVYRPNDSFWTRDAQEATRLFLDIKTPEQALSVFTVFGPMDEEKPYLSFEEVQLWVKAARRIQIATMKEIQELRTQVLPSARTKSDLEKKLGDLEKKLGDWRQLGCLLDLPPTVEVPLEDPLKLEFELGGLEDAIKAVLYLEKLQGIQHRFCALPDCRNLFASKSGRQQKFCSYDCSHKAAVRASRKRAREGK